MDLLLGIDCGVSHESLFCSHNEETQEQAIENRRAIRRWKRNVSSQPARRVITIVPMTINATPHHQFGNGRIVNTIAVIPALNSDQPIVVR